LGGLAGPDDTVWSVVCFFVPRRLRRRGLMRRLLLAAIETARRHGATVLEAYPVDPDAPSYRFMGFVPLFRAAGFKSVGRAGSRRHVMRLDLGGTMEASP
jgi:GNAT superfamily N-acetyltransferase